MTCPGCPGREGTKTVKNGHIHILDKTAPSGPVRNGKQRHLCRDCGRQFVTNPTKKVIGEETKGRIDKLLLKKIPLAGIARVIPAAPGTLEVSETWLQGYVNERYAVVGQHVKVEQKRGR